MHGEGDTEINFLSHSLHLLIIKEPYAESWESVINECLVMKHTA